MFHGGQKVQNYPLKLKITAIESAEINGNRAAEIKFGVTENEQENGERIKKKE